jgi:hypothetical protein
LDKGTAVEESRTATLNYSSGRHTVAADTTGREVRFGIFGFFTGVGACFGLAVAVWLLEGFGVLAHLSVERSVLQTGQVLFLTAGPIAGTAFFTRRSRAKSRPTVRTAKWFFVQGALVGILLSGCLLGIGFSIAVTGGH